mgnify:FL=1
MYLKFPRRLSDTQSKSDWLFNTQSRLLLADWIIFEDNENTTLNIKGIVNFRELLSN